MALLRCLLKRSEIMSETTCSPDKPEETRECCSATLSRASRSYGTCVHCARTMQVCTSCMEPPEIAKKVEKDPNWKLCAEEFLKKSEAGKLAKPIKWSAKELLEMSGEDPDDEGSSSCSSAPKFAMKSEDPEEVPICASSELTRQKQD